MGAPFDKAAFAKNLMTPDFRNPTAMQVGNSQQGNPTTPQDAGGETPGRLDPATAGYVDHSPGAEHCAACEYWTEGDGSQGCQLVLPPIQPTGWCKLFVAQGGGAETPDTAASTDQGTPEIDDDSQPIPQGGEDQDGQ